jgi:2-polyprenyl-3-methyl-5-hydroxy-6-metoxy-1,4-benzoquinol methylase
MTSSKFDMVREYISRNYGLKLEKGVHWKTGYSLSGIWPDGKSGKVHYASLNQIIIFWMQDRGIDSLSFEYYRKHHEAFVKRTKDRDMTELYLPFISNIPNGGEILDAGCGSGRDSMAFAEMGFKVTAMDACPHVVQVDVSKKYGIEILTMSFEDVDWMNRFDGIWASNSLLHVPPQSFGKSVDRLYNSLKVGGVMYMSFYHGDHTRQRRCTRGRLFTDQNRDSLNAMAERLGAEIKVMETTMVLASNREAIYTIFRNTGTKT